MSCHLPSKVESVFGMPVDPVACSAVTDFLVISSASLLEYVLYPMGLHYFPLVDLIDLLHVNHTLWIMWHTCGIPAKLTKTTAVGSGALIMPRRELIHRSISFSTVIYRTQAWGGDKFLFRDLA